MRTSWRRCLVCAMSETAKLSWQPATGGGGRHTNYARGKLAPGIPKSNFWASDPNGINQEGVYTPRI